MFRCAPQPPLQPPQAFALALPLPPSLLPLPEGEPAAALHAACSVQDAHLKPDVLKQSMSSLGRYSTPAVAMA
jgi:hypothetical protein